MRHTETGLSQQTARAFGIHVQSMVDNPIITPHDFAAIGSLPHTLRRLQSAIRGLPGAVLCVKVHCIPGACFDCI